MDAVIEVPMASPLTGLLREETLLLRWLFGYADRIPSSIGPYMAKKLYHAGIKLVRFISLDVDALRGHHGVIQQLHMGVSILDASRLRPPAKKAPTTGVLSEAIASHHFAVGSSKSGRRASNRFLFGTSEAVSLAELKEKLGELTSDENVVLVGHGCKRELDILETLGINLHPVCDIDTVKAAQHPLQLSYRYSLQRLLEELGIPFANLHTAGNDAHFVLRALLMVAVRDAERKLGHPEQPWLSICRAIAQGPRPPTKAEKRCARITAKQRRRESVTTPTDSRRRSPPI